MTNPAGPLTVLWLWRIVKPTASDCFFNVTVTSSCAAAPQQRKFSLTVS